jgi:hypothetical protein
MYFVESRSRPRSSSEDLSSTLAERQHPSDICVVQDAPSTALPDHGALEDALSHLRTSSDRAASTQKFTSPLQNDEGHRYSAR